MKKLNILSVLLLSVSVLFISACGSVSGAGETGEAFYNHIKNGEYESIVPLLSDEALETTPEQTWVDGIKQINVERGEIESFSKTGFNTEMKNGKTITTLTYKVTYTNGVFTEIITFIKVGEEFKIQFYDYDN